MAQKPKFAQPKKDVDSFVSEAEKNDNLRPWEQPDVRPDDVKKKMLYLPMDASLKLEFLSEQTGIPQQRILRDILIPEIDKKLAEYEEKGSLKLTHPS